MATLMESDTLTWLNNKLGSDDNLWSSSGVASQFTSTVMRNISQCFIHLNSSLKIKTLLTMLEVPFRNLNHFADEIKNIVRLAEMDEDDWVKVAANIVKDYPDEQTIEKHINISSFNETLKELSQEINSFDLSGAHFKIPLECQYLNETALSRVIEEPAQPPKHFTMRRKPKSAALRAKITQKANEAVNQRRLSSSITNHPSSGKASLKRNNSLNVPISHSKSALTNTKSNVTKKTKLLDIADQPIGVREQKKRKKILAMEMQAEETKQRKQAKEGKKSNPTPINETENQITSSKQKKSELNQSSATDPSSGNETEPDQSETDSSLIRHDDESTDEQTSDAKDSDVPSTPSYMSSIPDISTFTSDTNRASSSFSAETNPGSLEPPPIMSTVSDSSKTSTTSELVNIDPNASMATQNAQRELQMRLHEQQRIMQQTRQHQMLNQQLLHNQQMQSYQHHQQAAFNQMAMSSGLMSNRFPTPFQPPMQTPIHNMQTNMNMNHPLSSSAQQQQQQQQQKKVLSLSREKMLAAQEMFKSANCVQRAEKALILAFMAGSRENPFPDKGPVITIKLSEHMENVQPAPQADGSMGGGQTTIIEMLFEMNFETGLWRRLRRTRVVAQQQQQQPQN